MPAKIKNKHRLWQARHKAGLEQKQVALLLGHRSTDQISRYERGTRTPTLKTALKLEIIYGIPVRLLFQEHYEQSRRESAESNERHHLKVRLEERSRLTPQERLEHEKFCSYAELLKLPRPTLLELETVRRHVISLMRAAQR